MASLSPDPTPALSRPESRRRCAGHSLKVPQPSQNPCAPRMRGGRFPSRSQTRTVLSSEQETARLPSAESTTELTTFTWPLRIFGLLLLSRSQTRKVLSDLLPDLDTALLPSADNAKATISPLWHFRMQGVWLPFRSQTRRVLSFETETMRSPVADTAITRTESEWPSRTR